MNKPNKVNIVTGAPVWIELDDTGRFTVEVDLADVLVATDNETYQSNGQEVTDLDPADVQRIQAALKRVQWQIRVTV